MNLLLRAGALALALFAAVPALAQSTASSVQAPDGYARMMSPCVQQVDKTCVPVSLTNPLPLASSGVAPATSTAATGSVTSSAVTATTGATPAFSSGTATIPFTPKIGYGVRLVLTGGATFIASVGTSVDACATVTTLTAGGSAISYTGTVNEYIDAPVTTIPVVYCLVIAVTSGTESYGVRN